MGLAQVYHLQKTYTAVVCVFEFSCMKNDDDLPRQARDRHRNPRCFAKTGSGQAQKRKTLTHATLADQARKDQHQCNHKP
jgi:hypothetical protein